MLGKWQPPTIICVCCLAVSDTIQNADGPLLVEIGRKGSLDLGISLSQRIKDSKTLIVIEDIQTASIAERYIKAHLF